jgi:hypothetical protein
MQDLILVGAGLVNARHDRPNTTPHKQHHTTTLAYEVLAHTTTDTVTMISDYHVTVT